MREFLNSTDRRLSKLLSANAQNSVNELADKMQKAAFENNEQKKQTELQQRNAVAAEKLAGAVEGGAVKITFQGKPATLFAMPGVVWGK